MAALAHEHLSRFAGNADNDAAAANHLRQAAAIRQRDDDGVGTGNGTEVNIRIPGIAAIEEARVAGAPWRELHRPQRRRPKEAPRAP